MEEQPGVIVKNLAEAQTEAIGQINRQVLFQPATDGNKNLKFAVAMAPPGAKSAVHSHPGDEVALTLSGSATLRVGDREYPVQKGTAVLIRPGVEHSVENSGDEDWVVVSAYCDDCFLLNKG
ncbi:MAG: cupin domain-containing protein [Deltaproteobacteria bacterium]|nr:cupin domain-containing protein [Deltaproteobacteria bacterium]